MRQKETPSPEGATHSRRCAAPSGLGVYLIPRPGPDGPGYYLPPRWGEDNRRTDAAPPDCSPSSVEHPDQLGHAGELLEVPAAREDRVAPHLAVARLRDHAELRLHL